MAKRQATLFSSWQNRPKQARISPEGESDSDSEIDPSTSTHSDDINNGTLNTAQASSSGSVENDVSPDPESSSEHLSRQCVAHCCSTDEEAFQLVDKSTLSLLMSKKRNFQSKWYKDFPWISVCITNKRSFVFIAVMVVPMIYFPSASWGKVHSLNLVSIT